MNDPVNSDAAATPAAAAAPEVPIPIYSLKNLLGKDASTRDMLLFTIGGSAIVWYLLSITFVGFEFVTPTEVASGASPTGTNMDLRGFMEFSITAISGTLATYLGMVLGLSQKQGDNPNSSEISTMQKVAAWMYFASLIYALGLWGRSYFYEESVAIVISSLGQSILGLFGGALAVLLNTEKK